MDTQNNAISLYWVYKRLFALQDQGLKLLLATVEVRALSLVQQGHLEVLWKSQDVALNALFFFLKCIGGYSLSEWV